MPPPTAVDESELTESRVEVSPARKPQESSGEKYWLANFSLLTCYQVLMRTGWIFKTESIIMPAVLDIIGGPGWLRGCLPMLNRFGQSIPPVLFSGQVHSSQHKKRILAGCTLVMGLTFFALAAIWWSMGGRTTWWLPIVFLALNAIFFVSTGVNQLVFSTLIGKLVPVVRRGRLMLIASVVGTTTAVVCAGLLLRQWLDQETGNFAAIFAFTGSLFLAAAAISLILFEPADSYPRTAAGPRSLLRSALQTLKEDAEFRRLAIVGSLFGMSLTLFPHYQALGRERLNLGLSSLMPWVITQNIGVAIFSIPAGWIADRQGNRIVLRSLMTVICVVPLLALVLSRSDFLGSSFFTVVFFLIGATPVTIRTLNNFCLELAPREHQPRYLSTLSLCTAGPAIVTAPLLGGMVDWVGFETVFLAVTACLVVCWTVMSGLVEPRERDAKEATSEES